MEMSKNQRKIAVLKDQRILMDFESSDATLSCEIKVQRQKLV